MKLKSTHCNARGCFAWAEGRWSVLSAYSKEAPRPTEGDKWKRQQDPRTQWGETDHENDGTGTPTNSRKTTWGKPITTYTVLNLRTK